MKRVLFISSLIMLLIPATSWAQFPALEFSASLGYADAEGDDAKELKLDGKMAGSLGMDLRLSPLLSAGIGVFYMDLDSDSVVVDSYTASQVEARFKIYAPTTGAEYGGLYAVVALGKHWVEVEENIPFFGKITAKNDGIYASAGIGVSVLVLPFLTFGAEARFMANSWHDVKSNDSDHSLDIDDLHYWGIMGTASFILPLIGQ